MSNFCASLRPLLKYISHDDNGGPSAPGVNAMKKETPAAFAKLQAAWSEYATYANGEKIQL